MALLHIYVVIGFLLLAFFYKQVLGEYINPKILWLVAISFSFFSVCNSLFFQPIYTFNSNALTVKSVLLLIVTIFSFTVFLNKIVKEKKQMDIPSLNWINSGLFIYHVSNLLLFYFGSFIVEKISANASIQTWMIHSFFLFVMYIFFLIGLLKAEKQ